MLGGNLEGEKEKKQYELKPGRAALLTKALETFLLHPFPFQHPLVSLGCAWWWSHYGRYRMTSNLFKLCIMTVLRTIQLELILGFFSILNQSSTSHSHHFTWCKINCILVTLAIWWFNLKSWCLVVCEHTKDIYTWFHIGDLFTYSELFTWWRWYRTTQRSRWSCFKLN